MKKQAVIFCVMLLCFPSKAFCFDFFDCLKDILGMSVRRVYNDYVNMCINQCVDTFHHIACDTNTGTAEKTSLLIFC